MKGFCVTTLVAAAAMCAMAADASYFGKWKLNPSKSQMTGTTFTLANLPGGEMRFDMSGFAYNFRLDGKDYPTPDGGTAVWQAPAPDTWEGAAKVNGKIVGRFKLVLKGDSVAFQMTTPQPGGKDLTETSTWKRLSGGPGFPGTWQETKVSPAASTMELSASGTDGIVMNAPEYQVTCTAKLDGKPYPVTGPASAGKTTMSFRKTGADSLEVTTYIDGKAWYVEQISVSPDGKTMTDNGSPVAKKEVLKMVYDRQ